jgi:hypothetical protein
LDDKREIQILSIDSLSPARKWPDRIDELRVRSEARALSLVDGRHNGNAPGCQSSQRCLGRWMVEERWIE